MVYGILADLLVAIHCAYVGVVVLGQLAIVAGWLLRKQWVRNFWFRVTHLAFIAFVAFEEAIDMVCPLTSWENQLRELAGQDIQAGTFMGRLFHDLIFLDLPSKYFTIMHVGFAALVIGTIFVISPRRPAWLLFSRSNARPA